MVLGAALLGYLGGKLGPESFHASGHHDGGHKSDGPALIDDGTPPPQHTHFKWSHVIAYVAVGLSLWIGAMGLLYKLYGWQGVLTQMGWFFTKAALVTFGGAYAVLSYLYQGAVEQHRWLTAAQRIDGLALGETTPGPRIMVVTLVGFVGGWNSGLFGVDSLFLGLAGMAGATVATFFTFFPSFLFIRVGAPIVERTRGDLRFASPLSRITAAVVGVILNLALRFAQHVLWPQGFQGPFEWFAAVTGTAAFVALWRFKVGIIPVLGACGLAGLGYRLMAVQGGP